MWKHTQKLNNLAHRISGGFILRGLNSKGHSMIRNFRPNCYVSELWGNVCFSAEIQVRRMILFENP